ncbi:MAG: preprotein translocase subunit YajC [Micrococcales bacterium]
MLVSVVAIALFALLMFRSNQTRKKQAQTMADSIVPGAKVITMSGVVGRVVSVEDRNVVIESAGSKLEIVKASIRSVDVWESNAEAASEEAASEEVSTYEVPKKAPRKPSTRKQATKPADEN